MSDYDYTENEDPTPDQDRKAKVAKLRYGREDRRLMATAIERPFDIYYDEHQKPLNRQASLPQRLLEWFIPTPTDGKSTVERARDTALGVVGGIFTVAGMLARTGGNDARLLEPIGHEAKFSPLASSLISSMFGPVSNAMANLFTPRHKDDGGIQNMLQMENIMAVSQALGSRQGGPSL